MGKLSRFWYCATLSELFEQESFYAFGFLLAKYVCEKQFVLFVNILVQDYFKAFAAAYGISTYEFFYCSTRLLFCIEAKETLDQSKSRGTMVISMREVDPVFKGAGQKEYPSIANLVTELHNNFDLFFLYWSMSYIFISHYCYAVLF